MLVSILLLVLILFIVGYVCYQVQRAAPIPAIFKLLIYVVLAIFAMYIVCHFFGVDLNHLPTARGG
jgi:VIT1/CCC1 family predicted Fe2+/Mn2+ transporter